MPAPDLEPEKFADIVAVQGDPLRAVSALERDVTVFATEADQPDRSDHDD